ncbi:HlyU family transcriptional regulator [Halotalea alkalilenta]|uniref:HlyU family transcriptional regulator n=1 Tax=Halotalea alkalilenta TaxID=376489 RepID=UPI000486084E|nr:HlyU family transcriptional regulator [Halotalea alkalilenta]
MLKKLFSSLLGGGREDAREQAPEVAEALEYKGYEILAAPVPTGGQYRVSGVIRRAGEAAEPQEHRFERSDTVPDREGCVVLTRQKAQRFIDDVGERMFDPR